MIKFLILTTALMAFNVMAETESTTSDELTLADEAIESPTMNIEGQYQMEAPKKSVIKRPPPPPPARRLSASERLKALRERLEMRNRIMVEKKMEQIRYQQELVLAKQLERSMNQTLKSLDNIN